MVRRDSVFVGMWVLIHKGPADESDQSNVTDNCHDSHDNAYSTSGKHRHIENRSQLYKQRENHVSGFPWKTFGHENKEGE